MLRKITEERKSDWNVFQKAIEKNGFMGQLESMITELKRYRVTPELLHAQIREMEQFQQQHSPEVTLRDKLEDISYIYDRLTALLRISISTARISCICLRLKYHCRVL